MSHTQPVPSSLPQLLVVGTNTTDFGWEGVHLALSVLCWWKEQEENEEGKSGVCVFQLSQVFRDHVPAQGGSSRARGMTAPSTISSVNSSGKADMTDWLPPGMLSFI